MISFEEIQDQFKPKKFGSETYYFDKENNLRVIRQEDDSLTYAMYVGAKRKRQGVVTASRGREAFFEIDLIDIFAITDFKKLNFLQKSNGFEELITANFPKSLFMVLDYGMLEHPIFKGCLFSNSQISVIAANFNGSVYEVPMIVGEGVKGCDGNPFGKIENAFHLKPLITRFETGTIILEL